MKYKATVSFAGEITMGRGEVRDVSDAIAAPLVEDGYLVLENTDGGQSTETDKRAELESLTKDALSAQVEKLGIDVKSGWSKAEIISAIVNNASSDESDS
jgi:hypothetical protein